MIGKIAVSIWVLMILVSCATPQTENSTQGIVLVSPQPTAFPERAAIGDGGLLSGLPCAAPCVYGIRIGETSLDQVIPILKQNGLSECQTEESASWIGITCGYSVVVQVDKATSIVNATRFYPSIPISLAEIIEKYGEPDFVSLQAEGPAESPTSRITLFWDKVKMMVEMPQLDSHLYALAGTTTVEMVIFLDEVQYIDSNEISFGEYYQRWNGFGIYQP